MKTIEEKAYNSPRKLLNILKLTEDYDTDGLNYAWLGRKTTKDDKKQILMVHVRYPDIDWCMRTKTWMAYDENENQLHICDALKYGKNHWLNTFIDDIKNRRVNIEDYYV